jgi:zinc protease
VRGQQIANSASASYGMSARHETLFVLSAVPNDEIEIDVLEFALREEINTIKMQLPEGDELERVKAQVVAAQVYQQDSTFYQAMEVGMLDTIGLPWQIKDDYVKKILAVTAEQVQLVANKFLTDDRLTVAVLDPLPIENNNAPTLAAGENHDQ